MRIQKIVIFGFFTAGALLCASFLLFVFYISLAWNTVEVKVTSFETKCGDAATCHERTLKQHLGEIVSPQNVEVIKYTISWIDSSGVKQSHELHPKGRTHVALGDVQLRKIPSNIDLTPVGGPSIPFWFLLSLVGTIFFGSFGYAVLKDEINSDATDGFLLAIFFSMVAIASGTVFATKSISASYDLGFRERAVEVDANVASVETRCLARWPGYDPFDFELRLKDWRNCAELEAIRDQSKHLTLSLRDFVIFDYQPPDYEWVRISRPVEFFGTPDAVPVKGQKFVIRVDPHRPRVPRLANGTVTTRNLYLAVAGLVSFCLSSVLLFLVMTGRLQLSRRSKMEVKARRRGRPLFRR